MAGNVIRKKLDPQVEVWVQEARQIQSAAAEGEDLEALWAWASEWTGDRIAEYAGKEATADYTADEEAMGIENVRTGLREEYESEEEEDDEEVEGTDIGVTSVEKVDVGQVEFKVEEIKKPVLVGKSTEAMLRFVAAGLGN